MAGKIKTGGSRGSLDKSCLMIAGSGDLALPVTDLLAAAGIGSFVFLTPLSDASSKQTDRLVEAVQGSGSGAAIRLIQHPGFDKLSRLFPQEVDFVLDCATEPGGHLALESACRALGLPLALAYAGETGFLTGLVDPYAGSLTCLFGEGDPIRRLEVDWEGQADPQETARQAAALILAALTGSSSLFRTKLSVFDSGTGRTGNLPMPVSIPQYERLVLIGSDHRKLGKTALCGALARELVKSGRPVRVLKIETKAGWASPQILEEGPDADKPGVRFLFEAGCERVVRLMVSEDDLGDFLPLILADIYETMDSKGILLCESNTARRFLQPACFVQLAVATGEIKVSAIRTRRLADRTFLSPFTDGEVEGLLEEIGSFG